MDLNDLEAALDDVRPDDAGPDWGFRLMAVMLGNVSEGLMRADHIKDDMETAVERTGRDEEEILQALDMALTDMVGALFVAVAEFAHEQDVSIAEAVELRLDRMQSAKKQRDRMEKWEEAGLIDKNSGAVDTELDSEDDWTFA